MPRCPPALEPDSLITLCSGAQPTWEENWKNFDNITTLTECTLHSTAIHRQKSVAKQLSTALISIISGGNLVAADYYSYPWLPEQQFTTHRLSPVAVIGRSSDNQVTQGWLGI